MRKLNIYLAVIIVSSVISGCEQRFRPSVADDLLYETLPSQESWESTIIMSSGGKINSKIYADYIAVFPDEEKTKLHGNVEVRFFNEAGEITTILNADKGEVDDRTNDLSAFGNVIVVSDDGTELKTEELHWRFIDEKVYTDKFVEITSPDEIIFGYGLESDSSLDNYVIHRVTGQTRPGG